MKSSKRRVRLRFGKLDASYRSKLEKYLSNVLGVDPHGIIPEELYYTCFDEHCFIHEEAGRDEYVTLIYSGLWIGVIIDGDVYLSIPIYEKIYSTIGFKAAIVVGELGVKNFLYGRDILEESIVSKYPPLNNPLAVIDHSDGRVIGVVKPVENRVYKHIYDLSMFLHILG